MILIGYLQKPVMTGARWSEIWNSLFNPDAVRILSLICQGPTDLLSTGRQIPEPPANADDFKTHPWPCSIPRRFCICSSGTPLVSGTMVFTQINCSTIMNAKKANT